MTPLLKKPNLTSTDVFKLADWVAEAGFDGISDFYEKTNAWALTEKEIYILLTVLIEKEHAKEEAYLS